MSNEKFKKFLESRAERNPLNVSEDKISWEDRNERKLSAQPSDFLESVYLGKELRDTVVMERSVAAMLQHQLTRLEEENMRLRRSLKILKIASSAVVVIAIIVLWAFLNVLH
ncbi:MAG: hypothetical protein ACE5NN_00435 [Candidatus Bathyarchaeia archaeon]